MLYWYSTVIPLLSENMVTRPTGVDLKSTFTACYPEIKTKLLTSLPRDLKPSFPNGKNWYLIFKPYIQLRHEMLTHHVFNECVGNLHRHIFQETNLLLLPVDPD